MANETKPKTVSSPAPTAAVGTPSGPIDADEDEIYDSPFFDYLNTEKGHGIVTRILDIVDDVKKATITHNSNYATLAKWQQMWGILAVIVASVILTLFDKFNPTIGVLFGTLVGYLFGKGK